MTQDEINATIGSLVQKYDANRKLKLKGVMIGLSMALGNPKDLKPLSGENGKGFRAEEKDFCVDVEEVRSLLVKYHDT